jgi:hypothetical protein
MRSDSSAFIISKLPDVDVPTAVGSYTCTRHEQLCERVGEMFVCFSSFFLFLAHRSALDRD